MVVIPQNTQQSHCVVTRLLEYSIYYLMPALGSNSHVRTPGQYGVYVRIRAD